MQLTNSVLLSLIPALLASPTLQVRQDDSSSLGNFTDIDAINAAIAAALEAAALTSNVVSGAELDQTASNATTLTVLATNVDATTGNVTDGTTIAASDPGSSTPSKRDASTGTAGAPPAGTTYTAASSPQFAGLPSNRVDVGHVSPSDPNIAPYTPLTLGGFDRKWGPATGAVDSLTNYLGSYIYPSEQSCADHCTSLANCNGFNTYYIYNDITGNDPDVDYQSEYDTTTGKVYGSLRCNFYGDVYNQNVRMTQGIGDYGNGLTFIRNSYFYARSAPVSARQCPPDMYQTYIGEQANVAAGYQGVAVLSSYDVGACETLCKSALPNQDTGPCNYINVYSQKDSNGNIQSNVCALYSYVTDGSTATNTGATNAIGCAFKDPRFTLKSPKPAPEALISSQGAYWWKLYSNYDSAKTYLAQFDPAWQGATVWTIPLATRKPTIVSGDCPGCTLIQEPNHIFNVGPQNVATDGVATTQFPATVQNGKFQLIGANNPFVTACDVTTKYGTTPRPAYGSDSRYTCSQPFSLMAVGYTPSLTI